MSEPAAAGWFTGALASAAAPRLPASLIVGVGCVFLALFLAGALLIGMVRPDDRAKRLADRIERYGSRHVAVRAGRPLARIADRLVSPVLRSDTRARLELRLDLAGVGWDPAEWVLVGACVSVALILVLTVLVGNVLIAVVLGGLAGWLGMKFGLNFMISRRRAKFADQLPDMLQFVAGSLRSGFSLGQGLDAAVREDTQPVAGEFSRALQESRIGVDLEDALDQVADRMESADLRWTVIAIRIQRETGGNLAEVLGNTVETMRERAHLRRHVRALSAEGRLSAYILVSLPIGIGGWLFLTRRSYVAVLYTTTPGIVLLVFAVLLVVGGALWMRKMVKVEV
jgi:Flp pilus assembly protein TadB